MDFLRWRELILESQEEHYDEPADRAGVCGEQDLKHAVDHIIKSYGNGSGVRTFTSLRVPQKGSRHKKHEIDLLVAGPHGIIGLEAKNWGGRVDLGAKGAWCRVNSVGKSLDHECPVSLIREKMRSVEAYLAEKGFVLPVASTSSFVVLTNPRLRIAPSIERLTGVVAIKDLSDAILHLVAPNPTGFWRQVAMMVGLEPKVRAVVPNIRKAMPLLEQLPTWDRVKLHGGQVLRGDLASPGLELADGSYLSRKQARSVRIDIARSGLAAWLYKPKARWIDYFGRPHSDRVNIDTSLRLRVAGQREEVDIRLTSVVSVRFGYRDHSYYDR